MRVAQSDPDLFNWLVNAKSFAGDFLRSIAEAGLRADFSNYQLLRPVLLALQKKYPEYTSWAGPGGMK